MISLEMRSRTALRLGLSRREVLGVLQALQGVFSCRDRDVDVLVASDREVADYNRRFLGLHGPTNVLSFPSEGLAGRRLGSICLCADAVHREAVLYGQELFAHLVRLLAHGLLHLLGTPHGPDMDERMDQAVNLLCRSCSHF